MAHLLSKLPAHLAVGVNRIGWLAYRNGLNIGMRHLHASWHPMQLTVKKYRTILPNYLLSHPLTTILVDSVQQKVQLKICHLGNILTKIEILEKSASIRPVHHRTRTRHWPNAFWTRTACSP
ncbi:hypothetical protein [Asticcacaulis excentricus]|uniref:hypothetical protein n=1 Tax=Asticcacaulis excentricus TaxID=78587 RepID=UPI000F81EFAB|nr:hypothetical protein [Asticcacaulis excentricus]